jgi:2-polyprenyl-3-methyl-5-hydroxy-6-metoxy-1,4-benzoquinol methylase
MAISSSDFRAFSAPLQNDSAARALASETEMSAEEAGSYLTAIVNEGHTAVRLLEWAGVSGRERFLEVGAGGGLFTSFLQSQGVDVTAIEPVGSGFESTQALQRNVSAAVGFTPKILPIAARDLDPVQHGTFDITFSVNVIEHFQPLHENLDGLADGLSRRSCECYHGLRERQRDAVNQ